MIEKAIVSMQNLSKRFGSTRALTGVNLEIKPGRIIGLLGLNGSGKSTLIRHMIGLYLPSRGSCTTFGCEAGRLGPGELARIGYVHQEGELIEWITTAQLIRYVAAYYDTWNHELETRFIETFDLPMKSRVITLSPGQRQKLAVLLAIGHEPELLILDEPTAGLDPIARSQFLDLLMEIIQDPARTILISSHILSDVEKIIDHVIILDHGAIKRDCPFNALQEEFCRVRITSLNGPLPKKLPLDHILVKEQSGRQTVLTLQHTSREQLEAFAERAICRIEYLPLSLEDYFRLIIKGQ